MPCGRFRALASGIYVADRCSLRPGKWLRLTTHSSRRGFNEYGQLGYGDSMHRGLEEETMGANLPAVRLGSDAAAVALAVGDYHTCVLLADDKGIKCW